MGVALGAKPFGIPRKAKATPRRQTNKNGQWSCSIRVCALRRLPQRQREALILIAVGGFSYEDGAKLCGTPVGTVKSRVARARIALHKTLDGDKPLPRYSAARARGASEDILAQLSALAQPGAHVASAYSE